ncbi:hypothetical protein TSUD_219520 [Trifolium subterraneum]|uniref:Uncharacterized protein n=1 Tax=Trifolium subterraneum TaxID=3900 RepID=A0A2Z6NVC2_TRISU|nr:hypothetical protein TSUD_219520 [Trifolium subterraneum]
MLPSTVINPFSIVPSIPKSFSPITSAFSPIVTILFKFFISKLTLPSRNSCRHRTRYTFSSTNNRDDDEDNKKKKLSKQSSWEAKDVDGRDYLYRLGKEADYMNIAVADIMFDYRHKVTRSFEYLQGDYYIAPLFMDKIACHIVKNYITHLNAKVPLILGILMNQFSGTFENCVMPDNSDSSVVLLWNSPSLKLCLLLVQDKLLSELMVICCPYLWIGSACDPLF